MGLTKIHASIYKEYTQWIAKQLQSQVHNIHNSVLNYYTLNYQSLWLEARELESDIVNAHGSELLPQGLLSSCPQLTEHLVLDSIKFVDEMILQDLKQKQTNKKIKINQ